MDYAYQSDGYLKISGWHGKYALEHYRFVCPCCNGVTMLGTDGSQNGVIGSFACPYCGEIFQAYDDGVAGSNLYVISERYPRMVLLNLHPSKKKE